MGNPINRIESPASTALQVIEAHRLFHQFMVIVHGKAMPCTSSMSNYVILCLLCHIKPTTVYAVRGVFRGGHWAMAPLWVAKIAKLHRKVSKIETCPPPPPLCKMGNRLWARNHLILNRREDLFIFCSSPDFGRKIG